ncbi:MAG: hydantoinase/oxoprolinase family protein [Promethearchaeota archaeon]
MKENSEFVLSLDIGGANTKVSLLFLDFNRYLETTEPQNIGYYKKILGSTEKLYSLTEYFPFWIKQQKNFHSLLKKIKNTAEKIIEETLEYQNKKNKNLKYSIVATITAELSDAFNTKEEGIIFICNALKKIFDEKKIFIINIVGKFLTIKEAKADFLTVSASNWVATSLVFGEHEKLGILLDMGSTTLDLIPIKEGIPVTIGKSDTDRLLNNELLYTGVLRAPISSIVQTVPLRNSMCPISFERFAIMADVYKMLGKITEKQYACETADGRGIDIEHCYARLSRMVCGDPTLISKTELQEIAIYIYNAQKKMVKESIRMTINNFVRRFIIPVSKIRFNVTGLGAKNMLIPALKELDIPEKQLFYRGLSEEEHVLSTAICLGIVYIKKVMEDRNIIPRE